MFLQVCLSVHGGGACMARGGMCGRGHAWPEAACMVGGMCGGGHVWQAGCAWPGECVTGGHAWQDGHVWQGVMYGRGADVAGGAWQGACVAGGMHGRGHMWLGACMAGGGKHPSGMHSCCEKQAIQIFVYVYNFEQD